MIDRRKTKDGGCSWSAAVPVRCCERVMSQMEGWAEQSPSRRSDPHARKRPRVLNRRHLRPTGRPHASAPALLPAPSQRDPFLEAKRRLCRRLQRGASSGGPRPSKAPRRGPQAPPSIDCGPNISRGSGRRGSALVRMHLRASDSTRIIMGVLLVHRVVPSEASKSTLVVGRARSLRRLCDVERMKHNNQIAGVSGRLAR